MSAGQANQPKIRAKPHHFPLITSTGMSFAQPNFIADIDLVKHNGIITSP